MLPVRKRVPDLILDYSAADWRQIGDWFYLGENYAKAAMAYGKAITAPPTNENQLLNMYAIAKYHVGDLDSCRWAIGEAFLLEPQNAFSTHIEGLVLGAENKFDESHAYLIESMSKMPENVDYRLNLAYLYQIMGKFDKAQEQYEVAIKLDPSALRIRVFRAMSLLTQGKLEEGYREYELRYSMLPLVPQIGKPIWRGQEDLTGKTIVLCAEQGLGDAIQFARYAQWIKDAHGVKKVIVLARPEYLDTLTHIWGVDEAVSEILADGEFDYLAPLMSMPGLSFKDGDPWYGECPYMSVPEPEIQCNTDKLKVGFCWQGNKQHMNDRFRSIPARLLEPLLECDIFALSLQHDQPPLVNMSSIQINSVLELAKRISTLDLVITVDTATAHIAGALGKEVWMMCPLNSDWRWQATGYRTPWYSSMAIFRQTKPLDWEPVIENVRKALVMKISEFKG